MYDSYLTVIGDYIGTNVVEDDDSISFVYTHATNSNVTLKVVYHEGDYQVCWIQFWFYILKLNILLDLLPNYSGEFLKMILPELNKKMALIWQNVQMKLILGDIMMYQVLQL